MKHVEAHFKVVTPCFVGSGGDDAEVRVPSIKGALRFWWRALAWARYAGADGATDTVRRMREREHALFGSSDMGQSRIAMRLDTKAMPRIVEKDKVLPVGPGARYLGYGVMKAFGSKGTKPGQLVRPCLEAPFEFSLRIAARDAEALNEVEPALRLFGLVGGVGARSRKGYGSLALTALEGDGVADWRPPRDIGAYRSHLSALLKGAEAADREPEISAFSAWTRVDLMFEDVRTPAKVLDEYGKTMVRYRSWGRKGKILDGEQSTCRFPEDHAWMKGEKTADDFHPRRAVFGLPHNYGRHIEVKPERPDRRASPLFFHVHEIGGRYAGVALLLRSRFLPEGEKIKARGKAVPARPDWSVLTTFLNENRKRRLWPDG